MLLKYCTHKHYFQNLSCTTLNQKYLWITTASCFDLKKKISRLQKIATFLYQVAYSAQNIWYLSCDRSMNNIWFNSNWTALKTSYSHKVHNYFDLSFHAVSIVGNTHVHVDWVNHAFYTLSETLYQALQTRKPQRGHGLATLLAHKKHNCHAFVESHLI